MDFVYQNRKLEQQLRDATSVEAIEAVMQALSRLVPRFVAPEIRGRQMFSPGLDAAIPELVRKLKLADVQTPKSNDNVCILATRFYATGGHSKVAEDIARIIGRPQVTIIFTDIYRQLNHRQLMHGQASFHPFEARSVNLLSAPTMVEKIVELYMLLASIRPSRIFLIQNHMDLTAVAGAWPFRDVVDFIHHADHMPTLGATLPFSGHLDLTFMCHEFCRQAGVPAEYVGMTVPGVDVTLPPRTRSDGGPLRFATCAALHKYRQSGKHRWVDFAIAALQSPGSELIHIGPADDSFKAEVEAALTARGIAPSRYRFVGSAPNLKAALLEHQVDVYLASYPDTGARANLEAIVAGLAPIVPVPEEAGALLQFNFPLPSWVKIGSPDEVAAAIPVSLRMSDDLRSPTGRAAVADELNRFERRIKVARAADFVTDEA